MHAAARALAAEAKYLSAGTVEFIYDADREEASFLEFNTRLQVEHPVTEAVLGIDLVEWMIRAAAGDTGFLDGVPDSGPAVTGAAVEARVYAEDPARGHLPSAGLLTCVDLPEGARVDTWIERGLEVPAVYDPMLAKVITTGATREAAWAALADALGDTRIEGVHTNLGQLRAAAADPRVLAVEHDTGTVATIEDASPRIDVIAAGVLTTVQDFPGRIGHWQVGVPPSGPMDDLSFRLGNRALGNDEGVPGLECTIAGPTLRFGVPVTVCVTGAPAPVTLDGAPVEQWVPIEVPAGGELAVGPIADAGARTYVLFQGGLDVPTFLGSASTFPPGRIGGYTGDQLRAGDRLLPVPAAGTSSPVPAADRPSFGHEWTLAVTPGPSPPRTTSPSPTWSGSTTPSGPCRSTPDAPGCASTAPAPSGPAPTAARPGSTPRTSTTTRTRSAPSTSPATRPRCSAPTGPASAGSRARSPSPPPTGGSSGSCAPATPSGSCPWPRPRRTACARSPPRPPSRS
nr:hypothetical protein GCM10025732_37080 [Glycomyces mayteni]